MDEVFVDQVVAWPAKELKLTIPQERWQQVGDPTGPGGSAAILQARFRINSVPFVAWAVEIESGRPRQFPWKPTSLFLFTIEDDQKAYKMLGRDYMLCVGPIAGSPL